MELLETPFSCTNPDGYVIRGIEFCRKDREGKLPAIIMSHGFTGSVAHETLPYARHCAELGFRAFAYDFCGGAPDSPSEGSFEDYMTTETEKGDLRSVFAYVRSRDDVAGILLEGHSQGGFVSCQVAAELGDQIEALVLMYPALCIPDDARAGQMQTITFDPANIGDHIEGGGLRICGDYARTVLDMDIFERMVGYHGRVFLSHGTKDQIVPYRYAARAAATYAANENPLWFEPIEGAPHAYRDEWFDKAMKVADPFYLRFL